MKQGPPTVPSYLDLLRSDRFLHMERFSDAFVDRHGGELSPYGRKWVIDPLHQWSRQWEYPFVFCELERFAGQADLLHVLDAGSGITFLPYLIADRFPGAEVNCCDSDASLETFFATVDEPGRDRVRFTSCDMARTEMPGGSFDAIYCVSVLEHTDNHGQIVQEFRRLLRPRGLLIVTFDISLDGCSDITVDRMKDLLLSLQAGFEPTDADAVARLGSEAALADPRLVTTRFFKGHDASLLPWKHPLISSLTAALRRGKLPRHAMKQLAFSCHSFVRI